MKLFFQKQCHVACYCNVFFSVILKLSLVDFQMKKPEERKYSQDYNVNKTKCSRIRSVRRWKSLQYCIIRLYHFSEQDTPCPCPPCIGESRRGCVNFSRGLTTGEAFEEVITENKKKKNSQEKVKFEILHEHLKKDQNNNFGSHTPLQMADVCLIL